MSQERGSATIEIFARLQHIQNIHNHQTGSATIEIFARLQQPVPHNTPVELFCYHRNFC